METLKDILTFLALLVGYLVLTTWILPRFGVPT
jgi:hypothetical protein